MARIRKTALQATSKKRKKNAGKIVRKQKSSKRATRVTFQVEFVEREVRELLTVKIGANPDEDFLNEPRTHLEGLGAIVRIDPQEGATSEDIEKLRSSLEPYAAAMKTLPTMKKKSTVDVGVVEESVDLSDLATPREAILKMANASKCGDVEALIDLCEATMAEVGL